MRRFIQRSMSVLTLISALAFAASVMAAEQAGKVAIATGQVSDIGVDGSTRNLQDGDTVFAGDNIATGDDSYADIDFEDGGRILLRPNSEFRIEAYHYDAAAHEQQGLANAAPSQVSSENAFFRLLKGGLSAISGLIGHVNHDSYAMQTPVATIGIRGTAYELRLCNADCGDSKDAGGKAPADGLYSAVDQGAVAVKNPAGEAVTAAGNFSYVKDGRTAPQALGSRPAALRGMELPDKYKDRAKKMREKILRERRRLREELREKLRHRHPGG